ncbi:MBL fold metallo-hydrolase [Desulfobacula phenolica]|uniref:Glyoxylase, beta-lactamase superfamily II n=1 Tax=Desulfobacula phenolica TaxID=90732 RepID=A0A1H2EIL9_9BACT|nr:MBL fold metallo-hydrolase [Desulfobacula phenolica]SDT94921.1 Glyoxylase, beta-lactamase superfamily II [Desulfobacula phenolica]
MKQIIKNIYHVGDNECSVYMVDTQSDEGLVLIDAGMNLDMIRQINSHGILFENIQHCILTHCHIDHIGICAQLSRELSDIKFYAHELDAVPIEKPNHDGRTAASWYGVRYEPVKLYQKFTSDTILRIGNYDFQIIHTPGHTPGSISVLVESKGKKVLFGQDLHGPFNEIFLSDLQDYQLSMQKLLGLEANILCEGHFGIFQPNHRVKQYIEKHKRLNQPLL